MTRTNSMTVRLTLAVTALAVLSACGDGAGGASTDIDQESVAAAAQRVASARDALPADLPDAPIKAPTGSFVAVVACNAAQPGCADPARGAVEALEAAGLRAKLIDGQGTSDKQNAAIRQALALRPDGIITSAIDPETVQQALGEARRQGVAVVSLAALGESELVDANVGPTVADYTATGTLLADLAITELKGAVKALVLHDEGFAVLEPRYRGFVEGLDACSSCEVLEEQTFTSADLAVGVPRLVQQLVQRHPDVNTFYVDYDDAVPPLLQGLRSVGRDDVLVLGSNGTVDATQCIASDCGQAATTAFSLDGIGWAAADSMLRVLAGIPASDAVYGLGVKLIDAEVARAVVDSSENGMWDGDADYRAAYLALWGAA